MPIAISPEYTTDSFGPNPSLDEKVEIFRSRVMGWQIDIAERLAAQMSDAPDNGPMKHAGFALVSILFSYFEMIAQFQNGRPSHSESRSFFIDGFRSVYPKTSLPEAAIGGIYTKIRCGMYHSAITDPSVLISIHRKPTFDFDGMVLYLNPIELVQDIRSHFLGYVAELQDPANHDPRTKFVDIFDPGVMYRPGAHDQGNLFSGSRCR